MKFTLGDIVEWVKKEDPDWQQFGVTIIGYSDDIHEHTTDELLLVIDNRHDRKRIIIEQK